MGTTLGPLTDRRLWRRFPWGWVHPVAARFPPVPEWASVDRDGHDLVAGGATWDEVLEHCAGQAVERVWRHDRD